MDDHRPQLPPRQRHGHHPLRRLRVGRIRRPQPGGRRVRAGASIDNKPSARESIPIQLFLNEEQNDTFRGKVLRLAGYIDEPLEPADKARFDAVRAALEQGTLAAGGVDIEADLENETKVDLAPGTKPVRVSATGPADAQRITWSLSDGQNRFKILLEHRSNPDGQPAHTITVYADYANERERIMEEYRAIAYIGTDPDSPGTELAASLDQLSLEDLLDVLEHLRSPYKPTHAYYLQHVQAALARKKAFRQWMIDNVPIETSSVLATDPYTQLSRSEDQDYSALSYTFEFSSVWAEVKCPTRPRSRWSPTSSPRTTWRRSSRSSPRRSPTAARYPTSTPTLRPPTSRRCGPSSGSASSRSSRPTRTSSRSCPRRSPLR